MTAVALPVGKLPIELLARLLRDAGGPSEDVRLGPAVGEDACVLDVPGGVLVAATDPITLTTADVGRMAVIVNANDVAVCGVRPQWFLAAVLLPPGTTAEVVEELFASMQDGLDAVGATLVGGHTEITAAVNQPVVVGQMLGAAHNGRFVATSGARSGDVVVQVGAAPIEGAAVLAVEAADRLDGVAPDVRRAARDGLRDPGISVVDAALVAADMGATSMHDPTEGGLAAGLHEVAAAAGVGIRVDRDSVQWFAPGLEVCRAVGADPWATLASGSLLATFPPERSMHAIGTLAGLGHAAAAIGVVEEGEGVVDTAGDPLPWPERDEVARVLSAGSAAPR